MVELITTGDTTKGSLVIVWVDRILVFIVIGFCEVTNLVDVGLILFLVRVPVRMIFAKMVLGVDRIIFALP